MSPYIPILGLMALAALFLAVSVLLSVNVGPARYNRAKYDTYECGIDPTPAPVGGGRFPVKYYITAMLFIVFDIEIVFLYPWAVTFNQATTVDPNSAGGISPMGLFMLVEMVLFVLTVFIAYFYVLRRGGLDWD